MKDILNNATIVDVRTPEEFKEQHYPGAVNIPLDKVQQRINDFKKMQTPIVMYCRSGGRSGMAVNILKQSGLSNVINAGGLADLLQLSRS